MWKILISKKALGELAQTPSHIQKKFDEIFLSKTEVKNPFEPAELGARIEKLHAAVDCYKVRIGDYRVGIYLDKGHNQIKVATVFHRGKDYKTFP